MKSYDIYIGIDHEAATAHGPEYVYDGFNPADALTRFIADTYAMRELHDHHDSITELGAFDDDMSASLFPLEDGMYELHIYVDETDTAITIPPTEFVSITDAADMLSVTRQRVHAMLKSGKLTGRMVGNAWTVCRASVESRIAQHEPERKPFERYELDAFLGDFADDYDVDAIIDEATIIDYSTGDRYWRDGVDLAEICAKHDKSES